MIDNIESKRIDELTDDPYVTNDDFAVIDGDHGTRRVPISNLLVKSGEDDPLPTYGIRGMLYLKISGSSINSVYYKISDDTWVKVM